MMKGTGDPKLDLLGSPEDGLRTRGAHAQQQARWAPDDDEEQRRGRNGTSRRLFISSSQCTAVAASLGAVATLGIFVVTIVIATSSRDIIDNTTHLTRVARVNGDILARDFVRMSAEIAPAVEELSRIDWKRTSEIINSLVRLADTGSSSIQTRRRVTTRDHVPHGHDDEQQTSLATHVDHILKIIDDVEAITTRLRQIEFDPSAVAAWASIQPAQVEQAASVALRQFQEIHATIARFQTLNVNIKASADGAVAVDPLASAAA